MSLKAFTKKTGAVAERVTVVYQRKIGDGNFGSIGGEFHVTFSLPPKGNPDELIEGAFETVKAKAVELLKPSFAGVKKLQEAKPAPKEPEPEIPDTDPSWCPVHECQMKQWEKEGRTWYSHKTDDGWCSGKG